jgi:hypothetical protein
VLRLRYVPTFLVVGLFVSVLTVPLSIGASSPKIASNLPEFGVSVVIDDTPPMPDSQEIAQAQNVFTYVASLGADAVSINFPFYMASQTASTVSSGSGTPTPATIRAIVEVAEEHGLKVQLRPLMSETIFDTNVTGEWRGTIVLANIGEWFQSYWNWLKPYLIVAKDTNVGTFAIGSELNTLISSSSTSSKYPGAPTIGNHNFLGYWLVLRHEAQSIIGDHLVYAASHLEFASVPDISFGYDAYYPVILPKGTPAPSATTTSAVVSEFTTGMEKAYGSTGFASTLPSTRLEEVGIGAVVGAWTRPNDFSYPADTPIARWVQADWDTAMCDTFLHDNMTGIYFWAVSFQGFSPTYNADTNDPPSLYDFEGTITQTAIANCFAQIRAAH